MNLPVTQALALARGVSLARRERLGWCVLIVICAHTLMLGSAWRIGVPVPTVSSPARLVQVRQVVVADAPKPAVSPAAIVERGEQARPAAVVRSATAGETDSIPGQTLLDADSIYVPRKLLTTAPKPSAPVVIDYPAFDGESDQYTALFDLFIDDLGGVVRVVTATPELPGILSNAVREAFLAARFSPGEVDGHPVRSRMRIEVTFDSRRPTSS
jgi:hypothetical protein